MLRHRRRGGVAIAAATCRSSARVELLRRAALLLALLPLSRLRWALAGRSVARRSSGCRAALARAAGGRAGARRWRARRRWASAAPSRRCSWSTSRPRSPIASSTPRAQLVDETRARAPRRRLLRLVTFGRASARGRAAARRRAAAARSRSSALDDGDGSDLAAALQLAYGLYPPGTLPRARPHQRRQRDRRRPRRRGRRRRASRRARRRRQLRRAQPTTRCWCARCTLPERRQGRRARSRSPPRSTPRARSTATLTLYRDEFVNPLDGRKTVALARRRQHRQVEDRGRAARLHHLQASLSRRRASSRSLHRQQHGGRVGGGQGQAARALRRGRAGGRVSYLANALKRENIDVDVRARYGLPPSPRELAALRPGAALRRAGRPSSARRRWRRSKSYVRDLGGGFIMAGGENSFGSGGYTGSRLEKLLPVRFDTEKKRDQPALALALVHRSLGLDDRREARAGQGRRQGHRRAARRRRSASA